MSGRRGFLAMAARVAAVGAVTLPVAAKGVTTTEMPSEREGDLPSPDAALLALCDEFADWKEGLNEAEAALNKLRPGHTQEEHDVLWAAMEEVSDGWNECHDEIVETPATTMAGFRAKAAVLRASLEMYAGDGMQTAGISEAADPHERLAWSLACDLAGRVA